MADANTTDTARFLANMLGQGKITRDQYDQRMRALGGIETVPPDDTLVTTPQRLGQAPGPTGMLPLQVGGDTVAADRVMSQSTPPRQEQDPIPPIPGFAENEGMGLPPRTDAAMAELAVRFGDVNKGVMTPERIESYRKQLEEDYKAGRITREQYIRYLSGLEIIGADAGQIIVGETPRSSPEEMIAEETPEEYFQRTGDDDALRPPQISELETLGESMADRNTGRPGEERPERIDRSTINWNNVPYFSPDRMEEFQWKTPGMMLLSVQDMIDAGVFPESIKEGWPLDYWNKDYHNPQNVGVANPYFAETEFRDKAFSEYQSMKDRMIGWIIENFRMAKQNGLVDQVRKNREKQSELLERIKSMMNNPRSQDRRDALWREMKALQVEEQRLLDEVQGRPEDEEMSGLSEEERDLLLWERVNNADPETTRWLREETDRLNAEVEAGVADQRERIRERAERERILRTDPTQRVSDSGELETYPEEVELWMGRNKTQSDLEFETGGREEDRELWTIGQRERREGLRDIAVGSGLSGTAADQFNAWKQSGGKWPGPYTSMDPAAIAAAQKYYMEFGRPKPGVSPQPEVAPIEPPKPEELGDWLAARRRPESDEYSIEPQEPRSQRDIDASNEAWIGRNAERIAGMSAEDWMSLYGGNTALAYDGLRDMMRDRAETRRETSRRNSAIRAIMRRDGASRKAHLDRVNRNLPFYLQIRPEEVGLPGQQRAGSIRSVDSIDSVSASQSMEGEYLDSPEGMFRVGRKDPATGDAVKVPVRRAPGGSLVPDADKMTIEDYAQNVTPAEVRRVSDMIARSNSPLAERIRSIRKSRDRIANSDDYDQATKERMMATLAGQEIGLGYQYLKDTLPGDDMPVELGTFPAQSQEYRERESQISYREGRGRGGAGGEPIDTLGEDEAAMGIGGPQDPNSIQETNAMKAILSRARQEYRDRLQLGPREALQFALDYTVNAMNEQAEIIKRQEQIEDVNEFWNQNRDGFTRLITAQGS